MSTPKAQQNHGKSLLSGYTSLAKIGMESLSFILPSTTSSSTCNNMGSFVVVLVVVVVDSVLVVVALEDVVELTMMSEMMIDFSMDSVGTFVVVATAVAGSTVEVVDELCSIIPATS